MLTWIQSNEDNGDFRTDVPELRDESYSYWTNMDNDGFFFLKANDLNEFLQQEWEPQRKK